MKSIDPLSETNPKLIYPRFKWLWEFLLAFVSTGLAFLVFFVPKFTTENSHLKLTIGMILLALPILIPFFLWFVPVVLLTIKRAKLYPKLLIELEEKKSALDSLRREFYQSLQYGGQVKRLELSAAAYLKGDFYITLQKKTGLILAQGDQVAIVDQQDEKFMGLFCITEVRSKEYYAKGIKDIDPNWLGFHVEHGEQRILPGLAAFPLLKGEK